MSESQPANHAMGLELQIEELIEQQKRAIVQGRSEDAQRMGQEIDGLQTELAATAERAAEQGPSPDRGPELHYADELAVEEPAAEDRDY